MPSTPNNHIRLTILSRDASVYAKLLQNQLPEHVQLIQSSDLVADIDPNEVEWLLSDPDLAVKLIPHCQQLTWCQSTWAGNAPLMALPKQDYILTGIKGIFGRAMREYVFAYLLHFCRSVPETLAAQSYSQWHQPQFATLNGKMLGILGAGSIASALLEPAHSFGMQVIGLSRSGAPQKGYHSIYPLEERIEFAAQCDVVVNLLPDTLHTHELLDEAFFTAMSQGGVFINAGRGSAVVDAALISALRDGHLRGAALDVFRNEPLPAEHPFWRTPNLVVTSHTAAISEPQDVIEVFLTNVERQLKGLAPNFILDFERGY